RMHGHQLLQQCRPISYRFTPRDGQRRGKRLLVAIGGIRLTANEAISGMPHKRTVLRYDVFPVRHRRPRCKDGLPNVSSSSRQFYYANSEELWAVFHFGIARSIEAGQFGVKLADDQIRELDQRRCILMYIIHRIWKSLERGSGAGAEAYPTKSL